MTPSCGHQTSDYGVFLTLERTMCLLAESVKRTNAEENLMGVPKNVESRNATATPLLDDWKRKANQDAEEIATPLCLWSCSEIQSSQDWRWRKCPLADAE